MAERRRQPRFKVGNRAFALCWLSPSIIGTIIDVSQFGIAFSYIADQVELENMFEIGIMLLEANFFLEKISFQTVSDILIPGPPESTLEIRRHSGHFLYPTPAQQQKLEQFIRHHSKEKA